MKIVYITSDFGQVSETFVFDLIHGLTGKLETVYVICNQSHKNISNLPVGVQIIEVPFLVLRSVFDRFQFRLYNLKEKQGLHDKLALQKQHAQRSLLPVLEKLRPDVAYIDFGTVAVIARTALQKVGIPFVVHFHGADISSALSNIAYRDTLQQVFRDASALIAASNHIRRLLILEGAPAEKIHLVRLGVNLENLTPLSWDERKQYPPAVVFLGRLTPKKHPIALVEAFFLVKQRVPEAQLSMIGDGSEMPRVQQRVEHLGLKHAVKLYGALPRAEALPIVNRHWVFAQHSVTAPSGDQEGFGISLAEAAALGLPVVSTLHNGIPEQVIHGETGFLVREFDYEAMSDYMTNLLLNVNLSKEMGLRGRKKICDLCQIGDRVQYLHSLLKYLTNNPQI